VLKLKTLLGQTHCTPSQTSKMVTPNMNTIPTYSRRAIAQRSNQRSLQMYLIITVSCLAVAFLLFVMSPAGVKIRDIPSIRGALLVNSDNQQGKINIPNEQVQQAIVKANVINPPKSEQQLIAETDGQDAVKKTEETSEKVGDNDILQESSSDLQEESSEQDDSTDEAEKDDDQGSESEAELEMIGEEEEEEDNEEEPSISEEEEEEEEEKAELPETPDREATVRSEEEEEEGEELSADLPESVLRSEVDEEETGESGNEEEES
jgi:hypothetical protein